VNQPGGENAPRSAVRDTINVAHWLLAALHGWAAVIEAVTRRFGSAGHRYFGWNAFFGWIVLPLFILWWGASPDIVWLWRFWLSLPWLFALHRTASLIQRANGRKTHSGFIGESWLEQALPGKPSITKTALADFLVCCILCVALAKLVGPRQARALSCFLLAGGIANAIHLGLLHARDERQLREMEDSLLQQQFIARRFQERTRR
jgi:hypothetical protein